MTEIYENYDPRKKSSYINEDGGLRINELQKRHNSRVNEYSIGYCSLEGNLATGATSKIENIGR
jgi:hypothetical protein